MARRLPSWTPAPQQAPARPGYFHFSGCKQRCSSLLTCWVVRGRTVSPDNQPRRAAGLVPRRRRRHRWANVVAVNDGATGEGVHNEAVVDRIERRWRPVVGVGPGCLADPVDAVVTPPALRAETSSCARLRRIGAAAQFNASPRGIFILLFSCTTYLACPAMAAQYRFGAGAAQYIGLSGVGYGSVQHIQP